MGERPGGQLRPFWIQLKATSGGSFRMYEGNGVGFLTIQECGSFGLSEGLTPRLA
jgi:hypothetical protein